MSRVTRPPRPSHCRNLARQSVWIVFSGRADHAWQRLLRPGFRHCFAALEDDAGWLVLDPLTGRLLLTRIAVPRGYDLPGFYRRAGMKPVGPFLLEEQAVGSPCRGLPMNCVSISRAVLGPHAPCAITPAGFYRSLVAAKESRKKNLTFSQDQA
jgi:hypothetical protein